jgi:hypothetical protein
MSESGSSSKAGWEQELSCAETRLGAVKVSLVGRMLTLASIFAVYELDKSILQHGVLAGHGQCRRREGARDTPRAETRPDSTHWLEKAEEEEGILEEGVSMLTRQVSMLDRVPTQWETRKRHCQWQQTCMGSR